MRNIKKKLLSLGLTAAMVACYTPATILADEVGNQGNIIEVSTYQELKEALGYNKYDAKKGAFVATEGTAKEGDTIKLTADLIAETDKANPKGNKRTGDSATDARFDSTTGATVTVATNNVTIDGNGHTIDGDGYPTFDFDGVKGAELKNITVEDGAYTAKIGGAIFVEYGAEVSMDNITVKDSSANATSAFNGGGAIYINNHRGDAPKVNITNSQFINNKVGTNGETGNGGAIYGSTANLTVENTTFKGNKAANGGAIAMDGQSEFSSKSNTFKRNKAAVAGGAVYVSHGLSNTKKGMTIDSNVKAQMTNSTFKKNSAVLTGDDVAYARYYDETYTGDTSATTLTSDSDFTDVTFADKNRTQLATKDFETELTINNVKYDTTKVTGSGEVGATVTAYVGDEEIGSSVVGEDGKYSIEIPGQAGGTEITVKMSKDGYNTVEATKNVLKQIKDFNVDRILPTSTKITGTGMPGAYVRAYVDGEQIGKTAKVGEDGKYSVTIPKQALKTKVTVKISSEGYYRRAKTSTVLNLFKRELTANTVKSTSTKITGKGQAGAYVKATVDGKQIGKTVKVKSNGTYSITIPKQKKGTEIQLKMSKAGTMGVYKTIIVK